MALYSKLLRSICAALALAFIWALTPSSLVFAQNTVNPIQQFDTDLKKFSVQVDELERQSTATDTTDVDLSDIRAKLEKMQDEILAEALQYQPAVLKVDQELERLGPLPANGQSETDVIATERKRLAEIRAKATLSLKDAEILTVRIHNFEIKVVEQRRRQFAIALMKLRPVSFQLLLDTQEQIKEELKTFSRLASGWLDTLIRFKLNSLVIGLLIVMVGAISIGYAARHHMASTRKLAAEPPFLTRLLAALWTAIVPSLALAIVAFGSYQLFNYLGLFRFRIDRIIAAALMVVVATTFAIYLIKGVFAPSRSAWRLLDISDQAARRLTFLASLITLIYASDFFFARFSSIMSSPVDLTVVRSFVATLLIGLALIATVLTRLRDPDPDTNQKFRGWWPPLSLIVWAVVIVMVAAALLGYVSLGRFIAGQVVITGSILVTMYIGYLASRSISNPETFQNTRFGRWLENRWKFGELAIDQIGLATGLALNLFVILFGVPGILLQWGITWLDLQSWAITAITGFSIGGFHISPSGILIGIGVFVVGILLTRLLQRWLDIKLLARTRFDSGVKDSIKAGVGYAGYFLAAILAIGYAGVNLSNLALIAGALSLGIGFGLQNIVNNFVSGIIMLIERPIKTGDIVTVGGKQGVVHQINVRATEVETFERETLIIPNADMINSVVGNWMHKDHTRRLKIMIGVAYGSDVEKVREILMELASADPRVSDDPEPFVYFTDFGASSLDFQLRMIIIDINDTVRVESELRFNIYKAFDDANIEIPFPQTDVHLHSVAAKKPAPMPKKKSSASKKTASKKNKPDSLGLDDH